MPGNKKKPRARRTSSATSLQDLQPIFEDFVQNVSHLEGETKQQAIRRWFVQHAESLFPGIGARALSVPAYFTASTCQPGLDKEVHEKPLEVQEVVKLAEENQQKVAKNDIKGDHSQRLVGRAVRNLNAFLEREKKGTMFVISQVHYETILALLRRSPFLTDSSEQSGKGRKCKKKCGSEKNTKGAPHVKEDLDKQLERRGEIDLMIIHQEKGVLLIQIKGVGDKHVAADKTDPHVDTANDIKCCMAKARKQLEKDAHIFSLVMSNPSYPQGCQLTKVVALPNVSRALVTKLTAKNKDYQDILFLCEEDLFTDDIHVPEAETNISHFRVWWEKIPNQEHTMTLDCMKEIVGRYVGLLSTVVNFKAGAEMTLLRNFKDSVYQTWCLNKRMVLSETQLRVLGKLKSSEEQPPARPSKSQKDGKEVYEASAEGRRNYISGPPGSGKTLLLVLRSRTFLADSSERHVIVINMYRGAEGRSIGRHIYKNVTAGEHFEGRVHLLSVDVGELTFATFTAKVKAECPKVDAKNILFVIDEIYIDYFWSDILVSFTETFSSSRVLCAGLFSKTPEGFDEHPLDFVHRCPPSVQGLLYQVDWSEERKKIYVADYGYCKETCTNGPTPLCVRHEKHDQGERVTDCGRCATELAEIISIEDLVDTADASGDCGGACAAPTATPSKPIKYCKMVVLVNIPRGKYQQSGDYIETTDKDYHEYMEYISTCTFIKTLKEKGIDVDTKMELGCPDLDEDTPGSPFTTWLYNFQGLEAGVVIFLPGDTPRTCPLAEEERTSVSSAKDDIRSGALLPASTSTEPIRPLSPFEPTIQPGDETLTGATSSSSENLAGSGPSSLEGALEHQREIPAPGLKAIKRTEETEIAKADAQDAASKASAKVDQQTREPNESRPGVRPKQDNRKGQIKTDRDAAGLGKAEGRSKVGKPKDGEPRKPYISHSDLYWTRADIARFSSWDHTNIMVAGSRCLSLLILIVP